MNQLIANPMGTAPSTPQESAGARQGQSREMAETQAKYLMAQHFPRNVVANMDKILNAFTRPSLAEKAQYQYARGGTDIVGPSIRAAEAIAQQWGNMEFGFRELSRGVGPDGVKFSEVEAFAADLEGRTRRPAQFFVPHWRDTRGGGYALKDERDIYELISNQAQRRVRACLLALIPGDVTEAAMNQAEITLRTNADTSVEAMAKMVEAFAPFGVTREHIEKRIQRRLEAIQPAQVVGLKRVYASLRDDMSVPADWFEIDPAAPPAAAPPPPAAEKTTYPPDQFKKALPTWLKAIADGKKTADQIIATAQSKHLLTEDQVKAIRSPAAAAASTDPVVTREEVEAKLTEAKDVDALYVAGDLIGEVADPEHRTALSALFDERNAQFNLQ